MFYNINGIPSESPSEEKFFITENIIKDFIFKEGDLTLEIENICIRLRNKIAISIFGKVENLHFLNSCPIFPFVAYAGIDAEIRISKLEFEKTYSEIEDKKTLNKLLYYYDVENLISSIQNSVLETKYLVGNFYKLLNENNFLVAENYTTVDNGIQYASGPIVVNITSIVNYLFINLYSQLDFVTKLAYEIENLNLDFEKYPKLKSKDILYGDQKKIKLAYHPNSLFEFSNDIKIIMYLRNEIVHNASIDSIPKVYQVIKDKKVIEKFILLPDFENGIIKVFKNRRRFFNDDVKLNEILPAMITDFWMRLKLTLENIEFL
ncbi:hypothetical protein [Chryseobacterium vrystaatense]|uniref:Uncharacterized protein n=1 Tax=Chryseobacterium vrystaatense TaxID=307480 RepID=A0A1M4YX39_9FLAO|nr:hypothetical protein [Chryseobacterium vrystaatense]SHF10278.1 hypothetical protein SAMN02787073_1405 [Chryseobacterium vrystaatense]